ncbi:zinc ribbon domain-containing protein [Streptomyces sp. NPDC058678]|uniref:zinc ribbon domain-containing protein n=1 Tax=Streptomyces sp. NPDC058678 TaxID=3346595 RepID=UPI0036698AE4
MFWCRVCDQNFDVSRPMREAPDTADCPDGHSDTVRRFGGQTARNPHLGRWRGGGGDGLSNVGG